MPLELVWKSADTPEPRFDRRCLSPGALERLLAVGLLREDAPAFGVSCESCVESNWLDVFVDRDAPNRPRHFTAYCPEHGRIAVEPGALARYRVDYFPLVRCLADGMEMRSEPEEIAPGRVWRLGQRRLSDRPFYFTVALGVDWIGRHALPSDAMPRHGVVFLIGGERGESLPSGVSTVALRDVIHWRSDRLELDVAACRRAATGGGAERTTRRKATPTRGARVQASVKLREFLIQHVRDQKKLQRHSESHGFDWTYQPPPTQKEIARLIGVTETRLSRAINKEPDPVVTLLMDMAQSDRCVYNFDVETVARRK